jgi:hypothetical protein
MLLLSKSEKCNENYAARIARVDEIHEIPGAHSIVKAVLGTDTVVVSKDMKVGDIVVFFPVGCAICEKYLGAHNLYEASSYQKNANWTEYETLLSQMDVVTGEELTALEVQRKHMVGFFNKYGTVRPLKLRGEVSMGYVAPVSTLEEVWPELKRIIWSAHLGETIDTIGFDLLCWKHIVQPKVRPEFVSKKKGVRKQIRLFDRVIPDTFKEHYDTTHLERNAHLIQPEDVVTESVKLHGTSARYAYLPVNRELGWFEKVRKFFGTHISATEYGYLYATRRTVINQYKGAPTKNDEYSTIYKTIAPLLAPGMTVYGEIVGYTPTGKCIQSPKGVDHDYGCAKGECAFMPYRVTERSEDGTVHEWELVDVLSWTRTARAKLNEEDKKKLMDITILYMGPAGDQYGLWNKIQSEVTQEEYDAALKEAIAENAENIPSYLSSLRAYQVKKWQVAWIEAMREDKDGLGMELPEPLCNNPKAPREGIVVRIMGDKLARGWKLKTAAHAMLAQRAADAGEVDQEDLN